MENKLCRASFICKLIMNNGCPAHSHYSMGKPLMRNLRSPNRGRIFKQNIETLGIANATNRGKSISRESQSPLQNTTLLITHFSTPATHTKKIHMVGINLKSQTSGNSIYPSMHGMVQGQERLWIITHLECLPHLCCARPCEFFLPPFLLLVLFSEKVVQVGHGCYSYPSLYLPQPLTH